VLGKYQSPKREHLRFSEAKDSNQLKSLRDRTLLGNPYTLNVVERFPHVGVMFNKETAVVFTAVAQELI
jgi:hypothetical protein